MGSSLILTGGAAVAKTLKETVTQTGHGFTVGNAIRWDQTAATPKYVLAQADSAANAEVAGVVNTISDSNNFEVTYHGYIDLPEFSGISAPVMFLSSTVPGGLTHTPPSAVGTVVKPVLTRNTSGSGHLVMNYLGTQIGGSSTISVDEIQPVGTIMPFAGTAIPDTWLACDGSSYAISDYPELYNKTQYQSGDRVPLHGYIIELGMNSSASAYYSNLQIGKILLFADATNPTSRSYDNIGVVVSKTAPNIASPGQYAVTVKILPKYNSTLKTFAFANHLVKTSTGIIPFTDETLATRVTGAASTAHSSNFSVVVHALCPDLRGRTVVGTNAIAYNQTDGDGAFASAVGVYSLGQQGGEEAHTLTTTEMPAHKHKFVDWGGSQFAPAGTQLDLANVTNGNYGYADTDTKPSYGNANDSGPSAVGGNAAHNNMPPYLAVRYIIKAKSYTRAAIIDGIDLPYNSLLVRDLRSRNVGGANGDLVFHTNTAGDSGNGTERMRLTNDGKLVVGYSSAVTTPNPLLVFGSQFSANYPVNAVLMDTDNPAVGKGGGIAFAGKPSTAADPASSGGRALFASIGGYKENSTDGDYAGYLSLNTRVSLGTSAVERVRITSTGNVGIGTATPGASLDVNGTLKVGNFGGATNVMPKPARVASGGVGQIVPLMTWSSAFASSSYEVMTQTTPLHEGTWYVYFTGNTDSGIESENVSCVMSHVWTVPASKWLTFATSATFSGTGTSQVTPVTSNADSGVWYKIHDSLGNLRTTTVAPSTVTVTGGWTSLNSSTAYTLATQNAQDDSKIGFVYSNLWRMPVNLMGYAIRIA